MTLINFYPAGQKWAYISLNGFRSKFGLCWDFKKWGHHEAKRGERQRFLGWRPEAEGQRP